MRAQLLDGSATSVLETVRRLGFLQMDPISTVAPPQHLMLYSRLGAKYDRAELERLLWEEKKLFEYNAFIYPVEDLPLQKARMMQRRRGGKLKRDEWAREFLRENAHLRRHVLKELERDGPLLARDLNVDIPADAERHAWWGRGALRLMIEMMARRGEIAVAGRVGTHRLWDLPDRVFPDAEALPWREAERLLAEKRRRALGVWLEKGKVRAHPDALDGPVPRRVTFLSPFDRLVHDRDRAEALWGFHYRLEMYVPKGKREYGYYVLPILAGDRIVGRAEPAFDRKARTLRLNGAWWESGARQVSLERPLRQLARWLGAEEIVVHPAARVTTSA